ncbi:hypothetical protein F4678DRAFT_485327 [Xylaria arbuscula]|nr:hypothetical protein F4678DRAFT_485327 [Xylaria arbuscula]
MGLILFYGAVLATVIALATCRRVAVVLTEKFQVQFKRHILYPLVFPRRVHFGSVTRLDVILLVFFLGVNGLVVGWKPNQQEAISRKASQMALLNIVPLFLGGKTNPLLSFVGIPLSKYYFAYHWFGRVATVEAFIHVGLSLKAGGIAGTLYYGTATVEVRADEQAIRSSVCLRRPLRVYPGCYYYLYFLAAPFRLKIKGYPMNITWWNIGDSPGSSYSSEFVFLLFQRETLSYLAKTGEGFRKVLLDGPYGKDLRLYKYENVMLAAKGQGITGILSHALYLAERRLYNKKTSRENPFSRPLYLDRTRKVDLFWVLENNSQQRWLRDKLRSLQKLDPNNKRAPLFQPNEYWRCFYPAKEIGLGFASPGRSIVISIACGEPVFTGRICDVVI